MNDFGFINPAELTSTVTNAPSAASNAQSDASPRGVKRSRSEDEPSEATTGLEADDNDESKPRKRGRQFKSRGPDSPTAATASQASPPSQTPQQQHASLPHASPPQASPPKSTPNQKGAVKALPTVRDHTLETLTPEGDEYEIRDVDDAGDQKVLPTGHLTNGREYRCRTFLVPNRGDKLFMLATECARVLHYRDSYLLFNKNRSLFKIIATQAEKEDLIHQEILPYSYRSRQIAIVTARSMYRQFGSRMIQNGRRVRDDYWEAKARKQGFTEDDLATEKRPGQSQQKKEPQSEQTVANAGTLNALALQRDQLRYVNPASPTGPYASIGHVPIIDGLSPALPMIEYGNVSRPRQDISGMAYQDRTTSTPAHELVGQATQIAEVNKSINQQRAARSQYLQEAWHREHEPSQPSQLEEDVSAQVTRSLTSPQQSQPPTMHAAGGLGVMQEQAVRMQHQSVGHMMSPGQLQQQQQQQRQLHQPPQQQQQPHQPQPQQQQQPQHPQSQQHQAFQQQQQHQQVQQQQHHLQQQQHQLQQLQQQQQHHQHQHQQQQHQPQHQQQHPHPQQTPQQQAPQQQQTPQQHPMMTQSPMQQRMPQQMRPEQMHQRTPSFPYGVGMQNQNQMFNYPQNAMWAQQPQTPMGQQQQHQMQFAQSPMAQQSQHGFIHPNQMAQKPNQMSYQQMANMGMAYPGMQRNMMQQSPGPQQFMQNTSGASQGGMQGWAPPGGNQQQQQQQQQQQGWPGQGF